MLDGEIGRQRILRPEPEQLCVLPTALEQRKVTSISLLYLLVLMNLHLFFQIGSRHGAVLALIALKRPHVLVPQQMFDLMAPQKNSGVSFEFTAFTMLRQLLCVCLQMDHHYAGFVIKHFRG